jgi:hypothetical protein
MMIPFPFRFSASPTFLSTASLLRKKTSETAYKFYNNTRGRKIREGEMDVEKGQGFPLMKDPQFTGRYLPANLSVYFYHPFASCSSRLDSFLCRYAEHRDYASFLFEKKKA